MIIRIVNINYIKKSFSSVTKDLTPEYYYLRSKNYPRHLLIITNNTSCRVLLMSTSLLEVYVINYPLSFPRDTRESIILSINTHT